MYKPKKPEKPFRPCDVPGCPDCGEYRAPKDRTLKNYYWFCLKHVKEYNKKWDFYKGLSSAEIEKHIQNDITWQRPTWKLGDNQTFFHSADRISDSFGLFNNLGMDGQHNPPQQPIEYKHEAKLTAAMAFLDIEFPLNPAEIKNHFKQLAKKYHPDTNQGDKRAEKIFKELLEHYHYLLSYLDKNKK